MAKYLIVYCMNWHDGPVFYNDIVEASDEAEVYELFTRGRNSSVTSSIINIIKLNGNED